MSLKLMSYLGFSSTVISLKRELEINEDEVVRDFIELVAERARIRNKANKRENVGCHDVHSLSRVAYTVSQRDR